MQFNPQNPLPQNVQHPLQEWQALHERITIRRDVSLLQTENSATLGELFSTPALASILGRCIESRHARITPASVAAARRHDLSVPEMVTRLQRVHRGQVPPELVARLKAWGKYFGDAKLGTLTLIESWDGAARYELLDDAELKPCVAQFDAVNRPLALGREGGLEHVKQLLAEGAGEGQLK